MSEIIGNIIIGFFALLAGIILLAMFVGGLYGIGLGIYTMFKSIFILPSFLNFILGLIMTISASIIAIAPLSAASKF